MIDLIENLSLIEHLGSNPEMLKGSAVLVTAAAITGGVALVKMGISALGIGKKKREKAAKEAALAKKMEAVEAYEFTNAYADMEGAEYDIKKAEMAKLGAAGQLGDADTLGDAKGYKAGKLGSAQGYNAQGYEGEGYTSQGYSAQGTNIAGLQRGANTGLTNTMNNLQVSTAAAEMQAQEADQSLAASQDLAAQAGTGAGGATALAAAAAKSKQGISADIDKQVKANEQLRAQGEQSLQRDMLSQGNLASQFDLGQSQFNVGAQNTASQFGASARNQASQFNAGQTNQRNAGMFSAQNQANQFNASQSNAERMAEFGALQNANAANAAATNNALAQNAQGQTQFDLSQAAGLTGVDQAQYGKQMDLMNLSAEQLNNQNASNDALAQLQAAGS
jgi:hypothetical protein